MLRAELQTIMQNYFGVFRRGDYMKDGIEKLKALRPRIENVFLKTRVPLTLRVLKRLNFKIYLRSQRQLPLQQRYVLRVEVLMLVKIFKIAMMKTGSAIRFIFQKKSIGKRDVNFTPKPVRPLNLKCVPTRRGRARQC